MQISRALIRVIVITAIAGSTAVLSGCGGGNNAGSGSGISGGGNATGTASRQLNGLASVTLHWPAHGGSSGRLIPVAADSATVAFLDSRGAVIQSQLLVRPQATGNAAALQSSATFTDLPAGALSVAVSAYSSIDGSGIADAQGTTAVTIVAGQTTPVSLTLDSTIAAVSITPNSLPTTTTTPTVLTATATDSAGNVVVTSQWQWTSSNPSTFSISPSGATATIAPISAGTSTITVTETESGKSATVTATAASY